VRRISSRVSLEWLADVSGLLQKTNFWAEELRVMMMAFRMSRRVFLKRLYQNVSGQGPYLSRAGGANSRIFVFIMPCA
jgi:hypothetical protein